MHLSSRGQEWATNAADIPLFRIIQDLYDPDTNPDGYISLGLAENTLMHAELCEYTNSHIQITPIQLTYQDGGIGTKRLRRAMARFLTRKLRPVRVIESHHVTITNGVSAAVEHLSNLLGDPGDVFLLGRPYYGTFLDDVQARPKVSIESVAFGGVDPFSIDAVIKYEKVLLECHAQGRKIRALLLCHPHNPLGRCYPRAVLEGYMRFCQMYQIHLISDEIYALSVFRSDGVQFESALSISTEGLIDPSLVHVLYGLSKDFGANGLRAGAIVSQYNPKLHAALVPLSLYSYVSSLSDDIAAKLLEDDEFVDAYIVKNQQRLSERYALVTRWADKHDIKYEKGVNAAFFLWVDLGSVHRCNKLSHDENYTDKHEPLSGDSDALAVDGRGRADLESEDIDELTIGALMSEKVFLAAGSKAGSDKPGYFRIVFSVEQRYLEMGLQRIEKALGLT